MKKLTVLSVTIAALFSFNSFAADANKSQPLFDSTNSHNSFSVAGAKPRPPKWFMGDEQVSIIGPKPRPPEWQENEGAVSILGSKPRPPKW